MQSKPIELKSHFDVVRKLGYMPNINTLVSVSEVIYNIIIKYNYFLQDCLIKLWNTKTFFSNNTIDYEPYLVLRGHNGPLFSLAIGSEEHNLIYSAGNEVILIY